MFTLFILSMFGYIIYAVFQICWLVLSIISSLLGLDALFDRDVWQ